jgi:hypothetical protein
MKKSICLVVLIIATAAVCYSQEVPQNFLISQEDTSSRFSHSNPRLFPNSDKGFLIVWEDTRNGPTQYYAQLFDSLGNSVGKNFQIYSNADVAFGPDNSFLVEGDTYVYNGYPFDDGFYYLMGRICRADGSWSKDNINLGYAYLPWCGTGVTGIFHDLVSTSSGYLSAFNPGGPLVLTKYDWNGDTLWTWQIDREPFRPDSITPANLSACSLGSGNFVVIWAVAPFNGTRPDSSHAIMGTFFDESGAVLSENVCLERYPFGEPYYGWWYYQQLRSLGIRDSVYEFLHLEKDSLRLNYWKTDIRGNLIGDHGTVSVCQELGITPEKDLWNSEFTLTPLINGRFLVLISVRGNSLNVLRDYNLLLTFNSDGDIACKPEIDSAEGSPTGKWFYATKDSIMLFPSVVDGDIYLNAYRDMSLMWSKMVSDDLPGGNDILASSVPASSGSFFIASKNEKETNGFTISAEGSLLGSAWGIQTSDIQFFPNGEGLGLWKARSGDTSWTIGYSIYDKSFSPRKSELLGCYADSTFLYGTSMILSDSAFLVFYRCGPKLKLRRVDGSGTKEVNIQTVDAPVSLHMNDEDDSLLFVSYSGYLRSVSKSLSYIGDARFVPYDVYLGGNRFLSITYSQQAFPTARIGYYATVVGIAGDTLVESFVIDPGAESPTATSLSGEYFAITYRKYGSIFIRTYDINGNARIDPISLSSDTASSKTTPSMTQVGDKLLVAWSEARTPGKGYDVYGTLLDVDKITGVIGAKPSIPKIFVLLQNYPNPFNPTTTIGYQLPVVSHVVLQIYDILGREVATLVDERKSPGSYEVKFDGSRFASGVYFCRMVAGNYVSTRKLLMLK